MNILNKILLAILCTIFLSGCNSPIQREFNSVSLEQDLLDIAYSKEADSTDISILLVYVEAGTLHNELFKKKTYQQLLKEAHFYNSRREQLALENEYHRRTVEKKKNQEKEMLIKSIQIEVQKKTHQRRDWQEYIAYKLIIENQSSKPIRAFNGKLLFKDLKDKPIIEHELNYDRLIAAGSMVKYDFRTSYDPLSQTEEFLLKKNIDDLNIYWEPEKVIFADYSTIGTGIGR